MVASAIRINPAKKVRRGQILESWFYEVPLLKDARMAFHSFSGRSCVVVDKAGNPRSLKFMGRAS